jgi:hypothetical protein
VVENCLCLDAARWMREGILRAGFNRQGSWKWVYSGGRCSSIDYFITMEETDEPHVRLSYTITPRGEEPEPLNYCVLLERTRPTFGGLRWWFICPLTVNGIPCNRRVGKLWLPPACRYFGCRMCYHLTYTSCQESHKYDAVFRHMAANLGWDFQDVKYSMNRLGKERN